MNDLSFLNVPGFVAGVNNSKIVQMPDTWDLLVNVEKKSVEWKSSGLASMIVPIQNNPSSSSSSSSAASSNPVSPPPGQPASEITVTETTQKKHPKKSKESSQQLSLSLSEMEDTLVAFPLGGGGAANSKKTPNWEQADLTFMTGVLQGMEEGKDELWVRAQFREYSTKLALMAFAAYPFVDDVTKFAQTAPNRLRLAMFRRTQTAEMFWQELQEKRRNAAIKECDPERDVALLRNNPHLSIPQTHQLLKELCESVNTPRQIKELLMLLPYRHGGLNMIGAYLLHNSSEVRRLASELLKKLQSTKLGKEASNGINFYLAIQMT